jgi:hypothetical protein
MLEVKMRVTRGELEEPVCIGEAAVTIGIHVLKRASDEHIALADVWRGDREPNYGVRSCLYAAFDYAAEVRGEIFNASHPVLLSSLTVDHEVGKKRSVNGIAH